MFKKNPRKIMAMAFLLVQLALAVASNTRASAAVPFSVGRIDVSGQLDGALVTRTIYNGGWTSYRTAYFDLGAGHGITLMIYPGSGTAPYDYYAYNDDGWEASSTSSSVPKNFYPFPPIESDYRAYVNGSTPGYFYIRGYYADLVASQPSPDNGTSAPPFCVGKAIDWFVTVTNQGRGSSSASTLYYYLGTSSSDFSYQFESDGVSSLKPNGISTYYNVEHEIYTFVAGDVGTRYLNAKADAESDEDESNENNNTSSYGPFQVIDVPGAVTLSSPGNDTGTCSTSPTFSWYAYSGASEYQILIDNNSDFSSPERTASVTSPTTSYIPSPALSVGRWYWKVRAKNTCDYGVWSEARYVDIITIPSQPGLLDPLANTSTCDTTPTFTWSAVSGASQYRLQIDDNTAFSSPVEAVIPAPTTEYTPGPLAPGVYYWRVSAENPCGAGNFAAYRQLTVSAPPTTPPFGPPDDDADMCSLLPTFSWSTLPAAASYMIQVDNDSDFSSPLISEAGLIANTYTPPADLLAGTYYWRVAAHGTCGDSPWSAQARKLDLLAVPPAPALSAPAPNQDLCSLSPTFAWLESFQADSYIFQLADNGTFSAPLISQAVDAPGYSASGLLPDAYYWRVRGHNQCGDGTWSASRALNLHDPLVDADFSATPLSGNIPLPVQFTNLSLGEISTYSWSFGDGGVSTQPAPLHTYATLDTFDITLSVSGICGADTLTRQAYVYTYDIPPQISDQWLSNVRDTSFTVSWLTDINANGVVEYGTTPALGSTAQDSRGSSYSGETHYVQIVGLLPNTTYYYDIVSGSTRDDHGGAHYQVTTGPTLSIPGSDTAYGQVFRTGGSAYAAGAIVKISLMDRNGSGSPGAAAPLTALVDTNGYWFVNLGNARTANLSAYFAYSASGDRLRLEVLGGSLGQACKQVDTANDAPAAAITMGEVCEADHYEIYLPMIVK